MTGCLSANIQSNIYQISSPCLSNKSQIERLQNVMLNTQKAAIQDVKQCCIDIKWRQEDWVSASVSEVFKHALHFESNQ